MKESPFSNPKATTEAAKPTERKLIEQTPLDDQFYQMADAVTTDRVPPEDVQAVYADADPFFNFEEGEVDDISAA